MILRTSDDLIKDRTNLLARIFRRRKAGEPHTEPRCKAESWIRMDPLRDKQTVLDLPHVGVRVSRDSRDSLRSFLSRWAPGDVGKSHLRVKVDPPEEEDEVDVAEVLVVMDDKPSESNESVEDKLLMVSISPLPGDSLP